MTRQFFRSALLFVLTFTLATATLADAPKASLQQWNAAEIVFVGKLTEAVPGPVARSLPPIYSHTLHFSIDKVLRGPLKADTEVELAHSARQNQPPQFPIGETCIVAVKRNKNRLQAVLLEESTPDALAAIMTVCSMPLGWSVKNAKPVSPWASLGKDAWSAKYQSAKYQSAKYQPAENQEADKKDSVQEKEADKKAAAKLAVCSVTGRPALTVGDGLEFRVEIVPPAKEVKWSNPDGDGEYRITLFNPTDKPVAAPALLSRGDEILWQESVLILCQDKAYVSPEFKPVSGKVGPTIIGAGEEVSGVVNALALKGPEWPRGGYRIEFRFCLGEKSETKSFYYRSKHHDPIREALTAE